MGWRSIGWQSQHYPLLFYEVEDEIYLNFRDETHSFKEMPDVQGVVCPGFIVSAPTLKIYINEMSSFS